MQGWTLSETLVMMVVAGIVFVTVMDGITLINRYTVTKTKQITDNMRLYEGYYLLRNLTASSDSVSSTEKRIRLFHGDSMIIDLLEIDSVLVARNGLRVDTLIFGVSRLDLVGNDSLILSLRTSRGTSLSLWFPIVPATNKLVEKTLSEIEAKYAYE